MSKIEVNTIGPQCGTTVTVGEGAGQTVAVDAATVNLGRSGGTVNLTCGASQTGFGRTGTVDWITTPKVTGDSPVTGVTGKGYFLNTAAGTITLNLPAGAAGSIISMADYSGTWQTSNVTVAPNGSEKIGGVNTSVILNTEGQSVTLIYVDSTQGWLNTMDSTSNVRGSTFVTATVSGACNTLTTVDTDYKVAKFLGPGTFCVSCAGGPGGSNTVDYMVVAGGGGGGPGCAGGGGGGAGGLRKSYPNPATGGHPISASPYSITVGGGGTGGTYPPGTPGTQGASSIFDSITSAGGGLGGMGVGGAPTPRDGGTGGSGGGAGRTATGGAGNTPPSPCTQGTAGGPGASGQAGGGGGGHTGVGGTATAQVGGAGGAGTTVCISGTPTAYAGGGGGGSYPLGCGNPCGGVGGGGRGSPPAPPLANQAGTDNTGGGGGGGSEGPPYGSPVVAIGGAGGSGIVIIRYKFQ